MARLRRRDKRNTGIEWVHLGVGALLGVLGAVAANALWHRYLEPHLLVGYSIQHLDQRDVSTPDSTRGQSSLSDLLCNCTLGRSTVTAPTGTLAPIPQHSELRMKIIIYNAGRSPATDIRVGLKLDPPEGRRTLRASPNVEADAASHIDYAGHETDCITIASLPPRTFSAVVYTVEPSDTTKAFSAVERHFGFVSLSSRETGTLPFKEMSAYEANKIEESIFGAAAFAMLPLQFTKIGDGSVSLGSSSLHQLGPTGCRRVLPEQQVFGRYHSKKSRHGR